MKIVLIIIAEMILASGITAFFYWWDKRAAKMQGSRIPEKTLLLACLVGGWPGGLWASRRFRHKTQKRSYRLQFWVTVFVNLIIVVGLLSQFGA